MRQLGHRVSLPSLPDGAGHAIVVWRMLTTLLPFDDELPAA